MSYLSHGRDVGATLARLKNHDPYLQTIALHGNEHSEAEFDELLDCMSSNPNTVKNLSLLLVQLPNKSGVKLAQYIATNSTIVWVDLRFNQFEMDTYLALARALRINTSLSTIFLDNNAPVYQPYVDQAFIYALRINPGRPASTWWLYTYGQCEYARLKRLAEEAGHPTLQMLLLEKA